MENSKCPKCNSENINYSSVDIEGLNAIQDATCGDCEAAWHDIYTFQESVITDCGLKA